ncbi:5-(carboxyamino)imidazole ribonucleotide synthase [Methylocaldum szegediense]|uniref:N5-carboxyaminoimidazole ribonucleotide synthase n=1 Tax=Methylocaldum szegediense TaxID=73780 RepID=A0ABN8X320_9GAMM|nr:5-(carboxyamino)imidazole ribonucleotide synthase [Methylocaldum szegediense]CAI8782540.1 N5-carboxyaminoimidazole ribonucleotide synthase [Methylocaldum szegediense]
MRHILPNAMLGILGGGQLGRMFTMAARAMGYRVTVLDPDPDSPAGALADVHIRGAYDDSAALDRLADTCAAVTTEFENVPADSLSYLAGRVRVSPSAACVSIAQDRIAEKRYISGAGLQVAPFLAIESGADLDQNLAGHLPGILKLARLGYDGKGQIRVKTPEEARAAFAELGGKPCVLERQLNLKTEISVIIARTSPTEIACFPVAENQHESGILDISIVPARVTPEVAARAQDMALALAQAMDYVGVLAVEFFVLENDDLVINEIAPRPHNSGHYTLDACATSQFEQQVRTLCGLPPADTRLLSPVVMVNLLGDIWRDDEPAWDKLLSQPNVKLHLYGKKTARIGRKMGHFNVLAEDVENALSQALELKQMLHA